MFHSIHQVILLLVFKLAYEGVHNNNARHLQNIYATTNTLLFNKFHFIIKFYAAIPL